MQNFDTLGLHPRILHAITKLNFITPTPIQAEAIPLALVGKDILGSAQTGTGKTAAFGIPLITHLLSNPDNTALVMTPTRELASQVYDILQKILGRDSGINNALLIGGDSMEKQIRQLKTKPRLIVGTPGRINDHLQRRNVNFSKTRFLVLDETDRMLDMGFGIQIDQILTYVPKDRQTLLFSATLPSNILKLSGKYLNDPIRISIGTINKPSADLKQETIETSETDKYDQLLTQLDRRQGSIIIFVKTKYGADRMLKKLKTLKYNADVMHGDLKQRQRDRAIQDFRSSKTRIMIATDIASRGLDIPHIEHVINYDLPQCPNDYVHRIGRTARAGATGEAVNLVTPQDIKKWNIITRLINPDDKIKSVSKSKSKGAPKRNNSFNKKNCSGNPSYSNKSRGKFKKAV